MDGQRIDKWLWCARLYKTRSLANEAVKAGRILVNGQRAKPARTVAAGDAVVVRKPPYDYELTVCGLSKQRVSATAVGGLYSESEQSRQRREQLSDSIKATSAFGRMDARKPTKKERRERERLKRSM